MTEKEIKYQLIRHSLIGLAVGIVCGLALAQFI